MAFPSCLLKICKSKGEKMAFSFHKESMNVEKTNLILELKFTNSKKSRNLMCNKYG